MDMFLDEGREKLAAKDIRALVCAAPPKERAAWRRGRVLVVLPMGLREDKKGRLVLIPGRPTLHREDTVLPMEPGTRYALVEFARVATVPAAKKLVHEMEMAMIADIEAVRLRDLSKAMEVLDGMRVDNEEERTDDPA